MRLDDLTAEELVTLGHVLRIVPDNACLTAPSKLVEGKNIVFFSELPSFKSLWDKVAQAISEREDVAPYRKTKPRAPATERAS